MTLAASVLGNKNQRKERVEPALPVERLIQDAKRGWGSCMSADNGTVNVFKKHFECSDRAEIFSVVIILWGTNRNMSHSQVKDGVKMSDKS